MKVLPGDVAGIVNDGAIRGLDIDYQSDTESVAFTFSGFVCNIGDIVRYEWRVETYPGGEVKVPYTSVGLTIDSGISSERTGELVRFLVSGLFCHACVDNDKPNNIITNHNVKSCTFM